MKRATFLATVVSVFLLMGAKSAAADDCAALGGILGAQCVVSTPGNHASGPITLNETLHITGTGSIIVDAPGITIHITTGDLLMDNGALIDGNNAACGFGRNITINLDNGDIDLATGSIIRSNSCSGGTIVLTTTAAHTADID